MRLIIGDSRGVETNGNAAIFYDPPYHARWAYHYIPKPSSPTQSLLLAWDFRRFAVAPQAALNAGWTPHWEFVWDNCGSVWRKGEPGQSHKTIGLFSGGGLRWNQEHGKIVDFGKSNPVPRKMTSIYRRSKSGMEVNHPHAKPYEWLMGILSGIGCANMLDMFAGSGAGLFACAQLGMEWTGYEIDAAVANAIANNYLEIYGENIFISDEKTP